MHFYINTYILKYIIVTAVKFFPLLYFQNITFLFMHIRRLSPETWTFYRMRQSQLSRMILIGGRAWSGTEKESSRPIMWRNLKLSPNHSPSHSHSPRLRFNLHPSLRLAVGCVILKIVLVPRLIMVSPVWIYTGVL